MSSGKNQHVVTHPDGWAVRGAGNKKATKVTRTQTQAIEVAESIARNQNSDTRFMEEMEKSEQAIATVMTHVLQKIRNNKIIH